jgi:hypothetical protein
VHDRKCRSGSERSRPSARRPYRAHDFMFARDSRGVAPGYIRAPFQGSRGSLRSTNGAQHAHSFLILSCSSKIPGALPRAISGRPFRAQEGSLRITNGAQHAHSLIMRSCMISGALPRARSGRPFRAQEWIIPEHKRGAARPFIDHAFLYDSRGVAPGYIRAPFQGSRGIIPEHKRGAARPFISHTFLFEHDSRGVAPGYIRAPFQGSRG